jgi:hypothetical protein
MPQWTEENHEKHHDSRCPGRYSNLASPENRLEHYRCADPLIKKIRKEMEKKSYRK